MHVPQNSTAMNPPLECAWQDGWQGATFPALSEPREADVIVVGGGLVGMATAYHLAKRGMKVVLLEASTLGYGASGRNNGQVIPTFSRIEPDAAVKLYGEKGEQFVRLVANSAQYLFSLAREEGLNCAQEQTGWVQPAHSPDRMKLLEKRVKAWERFGAEPQLFDAAGAADLLGSTHWHGALQMPTGGHINPLKLVYELARVCVGLGVEIFEHSPVTYYGKRGESWQFTTPGATISARQAILATNAYTEMMGIEPRLSKSMIPVGSWQMVTEPIDESIRKQVMPGRQAVSDTRIDLRFFRYDEFNRIVTGCFIFSATRSEKEALDYVKANLVKAYPQLEQVRFTRSWWGNVGVSADGAPHVYELAPNLWAWGGCNGRGVALSASLGREFATLVQEGAAASALPLSAPSSIPMHFLIKRMAPRLFNYMRRRDYQPYG